MQGADGPECLALTKDLEEALGVVAEREKTSAFYKESDADSVHIYGETQK